MSVQTYDTSILKMQSSPSSPNNKDIIRPDTSSSDTSKSKTNNSDTISNNSEESKPMDRSDPLPSYAISLIAVGSIISVSAIIFLIYLKSKRNKRISFNSRRIARLPTVWSYPNEANISKTILGFSKQKQNTITAPYSILKSNSIKTRKTDSGGSASIKFEN
jgi:hypothetical protein